MRRDGPVGRQRAGWGDVAPFFGQLSSHELTRIGSAFLCFALLCCRPLSPFSMAEEIREDDIVLAIVREQGWSGIHAALCSCRAELSEAEN